MLKRLKDQKGFSPIPIIAVGFKPATKEKGLKPNQQQQHRQQT
jgi:hypothetical protein